MFGRRRRRNQPQRGVLLGVLMVVAVAALPSASASAGFTTPFVPYAPSGHGQAGWFTLPGTVTFTAARSTTTGDFAVVSFFGLTIGRTYWTVRADIGDCSVNGEKAWTRPELDEQEAVWIVPVPLDTTVDDFREGGFTRHGIYDVVCSQRWVRIEATDWFGLIPGTTTRNTWEQEDQMQVKLDGSPPVVEAVPQAGGARAGNGVHWHNASTKVAFVGTDDGSGIQSCSEPVAIGPSAGTEVRTVTGSCTNEAGKKTEVSYTYGFDEDAPAAPEPTVPRGRNGWHAGDVEVTWNWSDGGSGLDPDACPATTTSSGEGAAVKVVATCADLAGNERTAEQMVKVDKTAPRISLTDRPEPNPAGWFNEDVMIEWACADEVSGPETATVRRAADSEGSAVAVTGTCTDLAGNSSSDTQSAIKLDKTPPSARPLLTGQEGRAGWYVSDVAVDWRWADQLSGIDADRCRPDGRTEGEGAAVVLEASCADVADNLAAASRTVAVDLTDPQITATADREPGPGGWYTAPVAISYACADPGDGSGLAEDACPQDVTVDDEGVATVERSVSDRAGRERGVSTTVKVDLNDPTITAAPDRGPDVDRWYTSPVTVAFTCADPPPGSGVADCPPVVTLDEDGDRTVEGRATDHAGRISEDATQHVSVDLLPPDGTIARRGGAVDLSGGLMKGTATDATSGVERVIVIRNHPGKGSETAVADLECADATRRACTWTAKVPPAAGQVAVVVTDRVGREDPTPDSVK